MANEHIFNGRKVVIATKHQKEQVIGPALQEAFGMEYIVSEKLDTDLLGTFTGAADPGGVIVLEMDKRHFSFGEISRLVETNDAYITQLNTYQEPDSGLFIVTIRINKAEISDIVATFQRYEYAVRYYFGDEQYANELKSNYDHLLNYLNI